MSRIARGFWVTLGLTTTALALSGLALAFVATAGAGRVLLLLAVLPLAAALAAAGVLARTALAVAVNALAFCLPVAVALVIGFFIFAHPGGAGGSLGLLGTGRFWLELLGLYLGVLLLAGLASAAGRLLLRDRGR